MLVSHLYHDLQDMMLPIKESCQLKHVKQVKRLQQLPSIVLQLSGEYLSKQHTTRCSGRVGRRTQETVTGVEVYNITAPFGKLIFGSDEQLCPQEYSSEHQVIFKFQAHVKFGFNITVFRLYFPHCKNSFVSLQNVAYCGQHSCLNAFLNYMCFEIVVNIHKDPPLKVDFRHHTKFGFFQRGYSAGKALHFLEIFFVLLDKNMIESEMIENNSDILLKESYVTFQTIFTLQTFLFKANKTEKLHLQRVKFSSALIKLFDCPDTLCHSLRMQGDKHEFSTFQCAVQVQLHNDGTPKLHYSTTIISAGVTIALSERNTPKVLHLPSKHSSVLCAMFCQAPNGKEIEAILTEITYVGVSSFECLYGGVFSFENHNHTSKGRFSVQESDIYCDNTSSGSVSRNRLLSANGSLFIILFSCKEISFVTATVKLTLTNCKVIYLCYCVAHKQVANIDDILCPNQPFGDLVHFAKQSYYHLEQTKRIIFGLKHAQCVILKTKMLFHRQIDCKFAVGAEELSQRKSQITHKIQGTIRPLFQFLSR